MLDKPTKSGYFSLKPNITHNPTQLDLIYMGPIKGGSSTDTIVDLCNTVGDLLEDPTHKYTFTFVDDQNKQILDGYHYKPLNCHYYNKGTNTAVYIIRQSGNPEDLVFRVTGHPESGTTLDAISFDINTYEDNKNLGITQNLTDFLYYGTLTGTSRRPYYTNPFKHNYAIVKKYGVIQDLQTKGYMYRKLFFKKLIQLLITLEKQDYLINDFKPDNIGFDKDYNPIIIDYDATTISKLIQGPQTFHTNLITYGTKQPFLKTKQTIDGFVAFIFILFFADYEKTFLAYPWMLPSQISYTEIKHHATNPKVIYDAIGTVQKLNDVPDDDFTLLKQMIISSPKPYVYEGLDSENPPTYEQLYNNFIEFFK